MPILLHFPPWLQMCVWSVSYDYVTCKKNIPVEEVNQDIKALAEMPTSETSSRNTQMNLHW